MSSTKLGFVGFGEASYYISSGLVTEGATQINVFDINVDHPSLGSMIKSRANEINANLMPTLGELIENSELIICATSAKYATSIAREAVPFLKDYHIYVDINATSPMAKEEISDILIPTNANFVDAAVVESIPNYKHKVPILVSGNGTDHFLKIGNNYGMNLTKINDQPGSASAIKMARSTFMKGLTMLLVETLAISSKFNVEDLIMDSLNESITKNPLQTTANTLLTRTAIHAERRVAEMDEVVKTLASMEVDSIMSEATKSKLNLLVEMEINQYFDYQTPQHYDAVVKAINILQQRICW